MALFTYTIKVRIRRVPYAFTLCHESVISGRQSSGIGSIPGTRGAGGRRERSRHLVVLAKSLVNQKFERKEHLSPFSARSRYRNFCTGTGREHHKAHDRRTADSFVASADAHIDLELFHSLHEFSGRPSVQTPLIDDSQHLNEHPRGNPCAVGVASVFAGKPPVRHLPANTRLAMVMYLHPDSCAAATASASGHSSRTFTSLISIGRLIPASTSTLGRLITEIARFEGVPPNMSVKMTTPSPVSTFFTASMMSRRRCSTLSSGPIVIGSI